MKQSNVLGLPVVLLAHAFVFAVLVLLIVSFLMWRLVTVPLMNMDTRLKTIESIELKPLPTVVPTKAPEATPTSAIRQMKVVQPLGTGSAR